MASNTGDYSSILEAQSKEDNSVKELLKRYIDCAEYVVQKCRGLCHIKGAGKLERKCLAELKYLESLGRRRRLFDISHLRSSNLSHYLAVVHAADNLPDVTQILQAFICPGRSDSLHVDVVAGQGHLWVKVIARKAQALHLVWAGQGQFGERDILLQADDYMLCASVHPVNFVEPKVIFSFYNGITSPIANDLREVRVIVLGNEVRVSDDVENKLAEISLDVSDDERVESVDSEYYSTEECEQDKRGVDLDIDERQYDEMLDDIQPQSADTDKERCSELTHDNAMERKHGYDTHETLETCGKSDADVDVKESDITYGHAGADTDNSRQQVEYIIKHVCSISSKLEANWNDNSPPEVVDSSNHASGLSSKSDALPATVRTICRDVEVSVIPQQIPRGEIETRTANQTPDKYTESPNNNSATKQSANIETMTVLSGNSASSAGHSDTPIGLNAPERAENVLTSIDPAIYPLPKSATIISGKPPHSGTISPELGRKPVTSAHVDVPSGRQYHREIESQNTPLMDVVAPHDIRKFGAPSTPLFITQELLLSPMVNYQQLRHSLMEQDVSSVDSLARINLDISALITMVSAVSHGRCHFVFKERILSMQAAEERCDPVLPKLKRFIEGKELFACQTAIDSFRSILRILGGEAECRRAEELLQRVKVVPDKPSFRAETLPNTGKIKARSKVVFGTGDSLKAVTVTANSGFVRAAEKQGVLFSVFIHASRALTEQKEATAETMGDMDN